MAGMSAMPGSAGGSNPNNGNSAIGGYNIALGNNLGHHQTMFFGPAHTLTQYSSLPRRSAAATNAFQRNTPIRRSTGIPEHHMEYFVPRSVSEFNLSGVGDLALPPPRRYSPTMQHPGGIGSSGLPHGLQLGPAQTLLCAPPPPPTQLQIVMKPREKMVTFEDESKPTSLGMAASAQSTATHCPHGVPTTPRKATSLLGSNNSSVNNNPNANGNGNSGSSGAGGGADVFM